MKPIFVTGFHRAGTKAFAEYMAEQTKKLYVNESKIKWDDYEKAITVAPNRVLHCPGLAHRCLDLARHGKVYWITRNKLDVITSMKNAGITDMAWHLMKGFRQQFPNDSIWPTLKYDGSEDVHFDFVQYLELLIKVKEYFYETKFKNVAEKIITEEQPYYNYSETLTSKKPLKQVELDRLKI